MSLKFYVEVALLFCVTAVHADSTKQRSPNEPLRAGEQNRGYRLLCFLPVPMKSHHLLFEPIVRGLAARGHHVTLVTPIPMNNPPSNLEQVVIKDQFEVFQQIIKYQGLLDKILPSRLYAAFQRYYESFFEDPAMLEFLASDRQFDGIILEVLMNEYFVALHHKYKAPFIDVVPLPHFHWSYYKSGIPFDTSYIADAMTSFTDRMSFTERLINTAASLAIRGFGEFLMMPQAEKIMDKHLKYPGWETRPTLAQMLANVSLVLINTHYSISYSIPLPPHAKEVAGVNIQPPKPLPKDLQQFMDGAEEGVIVFSFGSHIRMENALGPEKVQIFRNLFASLKQRVLWKTVSDIPDLPANVKTTKWFPQSDVLGHPNMRLFMSHCGYHSSVEIVYNGLPALAIPVQADQFKNAKMLTKYGLALTLYIDNITETNLAWAVNRLLTDPSFKENARRRSLIYGDNKEEPLETAIYWIEYIVRHQGAHHLKPAIIDMPWYQQALIDVYLALFVITISPIMVIYVVCKCLCSCCRKKKKITDGNKKNN